MSKTIVVTGAGSGIGEAIAQHLAEKGFSILLMGRDLARLKSAQQSLPNPASHHSHSVDVRKPEQIRKALDASGIESLYGVVVNAGVGGENHYGTDDRWGEIIDINLSGSYYTAQECLPYLKKDPSPYRRILFMSSILARLGVPAYTGYCASKAGLLGLMRSFAAELAQADILVNAICPGWVDTAMAHQGLEGMAKVFDISKEEAYRKAMSEVPLGRMSEPADVARLTGFLMAEETTAFTGQTFDPNGGALMA